MMGDGQPDLREFRGVMDQELLQPRQLLRPVRLQTCLDRVVDSIEDQMAAHHALLGCGALPPDRRAHSAIVWPCRPSRKSNADSPTRGMSGPRPGQEPGVFPGKDIITRRRVPRGQGRPVRQICPPTGVVPTNCHAERPGTRVARAGRISAATAAIPSPNCLLRRVMRPPVPTVGSSPGLPGTFVAFGWTGVHGKSSRSGEVRRTGSARHKEIRWQPTRSTSATCCSSTRPGLPKQDAWQPRADVHRMPGGWLVKFELAGVRPEDVRADRAGRQPAGARHAAGRVPLRRARLLPHGDHLQPVRADPGTARALGSGRHRGHRTVGGMLLVRIVTEGRP